ncbi:MAG: T9SS type A sorting domain-containing protein [Candidatus Cloacimonetes bacterium]|nr:T9SS type A sorting domain-containing protein [Candidatus Cloacimonadota bacterium]
MKTEWLLIAVLMIISVFVYAQEPQLVVNAIATTPIPYAYDYVIKLPGGDLQFYKYTHSASSIQINGFQFLAETNQITDLVNIGTVTGLVGIEPFNNIYLIRYGKLYYITKFASGIGVIVLDQNTLFYRVIDEFSYGNYFVLYRQTDIVAEDALAIALPDSLVLYNLQDGSFQNLLQGDEYQCEISHTPAVVALPESYFIYAKDTGAGSHPEVWFIFDFEGNHIAVQSSNDPDLLISQFGKLSEDYPNKVFGRWYIPTPTLLEQDAWLECSFIEPDSLHYYFFYSPYWSAYTTQISSFGNDRILRMIESNLGYIMLCNYAPLEQHPQEVYSFVFGNHNPRISPISNEITTMSVRLPDSIAILALWTHDFPTVHEFYFPAPTTTQFGCTAFTQNDLLHIINNQAIYSYYVGVSTSVSDEVADIPSTDLLIYPNPVRQGQLITIESSAKQPMIIDIYNLKGQLVQTLTLDGSGKCRWNLSDPQGKGLASGLYIVKQRGYDEVKPRKLMLIK